MDQSWTQIHKTLLLAGALPHHWRLNDIYNIFPLPKSQKVVKLQKGPKDT